MLWVPCTASAWIETRKKTRSRSKAVIDACPLDDATDEAVVASYEQAYEPAEGAASVLPLAPMSSLSLSPRFLRTTSIYIN